MPLNDDQKHEIEKIFLSFNEDNTGALSYDEFYNFLEFAWSNESTIQSMWSFNLNHPIAKFIFNGVCSQDSKSVLFSEISKLIEAIVDQNNDYLIRFTYRAMDSERSDNIPIEAIPQAAALFGFDNSENKIYQKIHRLFGKYKQNLTYQEFCQLITNAPKIDIPFTAERETPEGDETKTASKSSCCLLI